MIAAVVLALVTTGTWNLSHVRNEYVLETRWHSDDGRSNESNGKTVDPNTLGIPSDVLSSSAGQTLTFKQHREAGDFVFQGWIKSGEGAGTYTFTSNDAFFDA